MQENTTNHTSSSDFSFSKDTSKLQRRVWTRWEDGSDPVCVWKNEEDGTIYEFVRGTRSEFFQSPRKLLKAIKGKDSRLTFDRYFKLDEDRELLVKPSITEVLDQFHQKLYAPAPKLSRVKTKPTFIEESYEKFEFKTRKGGLKLTQSANESLVRGLVESFQGLDREFREAIGQSKLGIDLVNRGHEVRKLLFAGFRGQMLSKGYDPEDVLQEIYAGLLTRNAGKCPWDGKKSTFGYYCTMVIRCVLTNYHRKMSRKLDREAAELDEGIVLPTTFQANTSWLGAAGTDEMARESLEHWLAVKDTPEAALAVKLLPYVEQGMGRKEIVVETGLKETMVSKGMAYLRERARAWAAEVGVTVRERVRRRTK